MSDAHIDASIALKRLTHKQLFNEFEGGTAAALWNSRYATLILVGEKSNEFLEFSPHRGSLSSINSLTLEALSVLDRSRVNDLDELYLSAPLIRGRSSCDLGGPRPRGKFENSVSPVFPFCRIAQFRNERRWQLSNRTVSSETSSARERWCRNLNRRNGMR